MANPTTGEALSSVGDWLAHLEDIEKVAAELTLAHWLGVERTRIIGFPDTLVPACLHPQILTWAKALRQGVPLAYLTGQHGFWDMTLEVDTSVLVPRPETELLVEETLQIVRHSPSSDRARKLLDLGTGSGAIAIALSRELPTWQVTGVDNQADSLTLAKRNAASFNAPIRFVLSDWFSQLDDQWNIILGNPPYIAPDDPHLPGLQAEPRHALVADEEGLADIRHIAQTAPSFLQPGGWLMLEHGYDQGAQVRALFVGNGFEDVASIMDLGGHERVTRGRFGHE